MDLPLHAGEGLELEAALGPFAAGLAAAVEGAQAGVDGTLVGLGAEPVGVGAGGLEGSVFPARLSVTVCLVHLQVSGEE